MYQIAISFKTNPNKAIVKFDDEEVRDAAFNSMINRMTHIWTNDQCIINLSEAAYIEKRTNLVDRN